MWRAKRTLTRTGRVAREVRAIMDAPSPVKLDLGGIGSGNRGFRTVNLVEGVDVRADILEVDTFCGDESVDTFLLSHTLEHIPVHRLNGFLESLYRKLRRGGCTIVIQTDAKRTLELYRWGRIDFYCLRDILFSPRRSRIASVEQTGSDLMQHSFAWGAKDLAHEFGAVGFRPVVAFDAGHWPFDVPSDLPIQRNEHYFGTPIPNLGVLAKKT